MIDLIGHPRYVNGMVSGTRRWYGGTLAARPPCAGCKPILNAFQSDNNGQNVQFIERKFMLFAA
jgi:hypothetical protein